MKRPTYYSIAKAAIEEDSLPTIRSIQEIIPITVLTQDMRINYNTLSKRLLDPAQFTMEDVNKMAHLIGVDSTILFRKIEKEVNR